MSRVGDRIKEARLKANIPQKALAKKLGVSEKYINEVEMGRKVAQESFINKASKVLNTDLNDINMVVTDEDLMEEKRVAKESRPSFKKDNKSNEVWENAFSSVLKNVPIYDYELKNVKGHKELPIHSNKVEGYPQDKVIYLEVSDDEMSGFRMLRGDLVFGHLVTELNQNGFYLVNYKGETKIREVRRLDNSKVLLMSNRGSAMTETVEVRNMKVVAKLDRVEIKL
ncbi:helix-turn-helix domain-containing protein [Clostridium sardiniense]|uniref:Helix-turn-helix domain-containing protein n=1 Tax=Clostridium sardiniense TaxID=29369 RepID=A0ABS7KZN0_CLOSR|nr:helix-turn-helix domain-containing protein [Clostridium sardiniense]MBY0755972.1 helix-turn-helix domain-containing protein [Clostridium sardiniense]MDQ0460738.1 transcriptional regulator with XRE-family HTH domain [Clostridium sardiniense]